MIAPRTPPIFPGIEPALLREFTEAAFAYREQLADQMLAELGRIRQVFTAPATPEDATLNDAERASALRSLDKTIGAVLGHEGVMRLSAQLGGGRLLEQNEHYRRLAARPGRTPAEEARLVDLAGVIGASIRVIHQGISDLERATQALHEGAMIGPETALLALQRFKAVQDYLKLLMIFGNRAQSSLLPLE